MEGPLAHEDVDGGGPANLGAPSARQTHVDEDVRDGSSARAGDVLTTGTPSTSGGVEAAGGRAPVAGSLADCVDEGGAAGRATMESQSVVGGLAADGGVVEVPGAAQRAGGGEGTNAARALEVLYDSLLQDDDDSGGE